MRRRLKKIYGALRKVSPTRLNGWLSKLALQVSDKPVYRKDTINQFNKFPSKEKGGLIISADFEMSWAWRFTKTGADHILKGQIERENIPKILTVLEEFNIPITFATVGHLFLKSCSQGDHDWMARIPHFNDHWKFTKGDWYAHDPNSNYTNASEWYAPDLIQKIIDSPVNHEIGTHTFSHIDFSYKNCPKKVADDEIKACIESAKPFEVKLESMVFPGGTWGNIKTLKKYNFSIYRKRCEFELAYPYKDKFGLLVSPSSGSLEYNLGYGWSPEYYINKLVKYLNKAIKTNTIAHFWFHPSLDPFILQNILPPFLIYANQLREKGDLWIGTMRDISDHINKNKVL